MPWHSLFGAASVRAGGNHGEKSVDNPIDSFYGSMIKYRKALKQWKRSSGRGARMANPSRMLTTAQAASMLGVSTGTVTYYIRRGMLTASETPGGHYRIAQADVEAFLARLSHPQEDGARIIAFS